MSHTARKPYQINHPGGKDGWWKCECSCGEYSSIQAYPGYAERRVAEHIRGKEAFEKQVLARLRR